VESSVDGFVSARFLITSNGFLGASTAEEAAAFFGGGLSSTTWINRRFFGGRGRDSASESESGTVRSISTEAGFAMLLIRGGFEWFKHHLLTARQWP
jgi:hypothetical protein